jgi:hypothetical protein
VLDRSRYHGKLISYVYDFGDNWWHIAYPKSRSEAIDQPLCMARTNHAAGCNKSGPLTAEEKERIWRYENIWGNGNPLGLGNGREEVWKKEEANEKLREARDDEDEDVDFADDAEGRADFKSLSGEMVEQTEREYREHKLKRRQWREEERLNI